jgi:hypothetical protein
MSVELAPETPATDEDRLLAAEALVRSYCGWHIAPERTETLTLDGTSASTLVMPTLHVVDVASVTLDGVPLDTTEYAWHVEGFIDATTWATGYCWLSLPRGVAVELTHGYDDVPAGVTAAVRSLAQRMSSGSLGLSSITRGPFSESYASASAIGAVESAALAPYKLPFRP